ncbi:hypothetical protein [Streptomyces hydrogenans]|uniref:hypothetical protein n=1 Tax=Streptomyces hydrogenans TaxID=1873719 RepID=UPI0035D7AE7E
MKGSYRTRSVASSRDTPCRRAPTLITAKRAASPGPGSVIVDMAAVLGGSVPGIVRGGSVVADNGVTGSPTGPRPGRPGAALAHRRE